MFADLFIVSIFHFPSRTDIWNFKKI